MLDNLNITVSPFLMHIIYGMWLTMQTVVLKHQARFRWNHWLLRCCLWIF